MSELTTPSVSIVDGVLHLKTEMGAFFLSSAETRAIREFFQAKRDAELNRWRDPEVPEWVAYTTRDLTYPGRVVRLVDERNGIMREITETEAMEPGPTLAIKIAHRFFAAHPVSKPWHEAKPGEVWVLTIQQDSDDPMERAGLVRPANEGPYFTTAIGSYDLDDPHITAATRIYPVEVNE